MAASAALNIVVLGISGILSIPAFTSLFAQPQPDKITINIGVGATNSEVSPPPGTNGPGGNTPNVELFDVNGNSLGRATSSVVVVDGGSVGLTIGGAEGSTASETPEYIQLEASGADEVCIAWFTTSSGASDGADFRSWNGATAQFCGLPWYPSTAQFPGVSTPYQPPCFWMSDDGRFVTAFSARLTDFFFPGSSGPANSTATQWQEFPDTLCKAPARQQFYDNIGVCIPFYPSGLSVVNQKDPDTGFDVDFEAIESSFTMSCPAAGIPFDCDVNIDPGLPPQPCSVSINADPNLTLPASITSELQSEIVFNLGGGTVTPTPPAAAATADGVGNFGGVVGEIPASEVGQQPTTTTIIAKTQTSTVAEGQDVILVSINPGGPSATPEVFTYRSAKARARRSAHRASILQRRADLKDYLPRATSATAAHNEPPTITAAPSPAPKKQRAAHVKRKEPVLNRRVERRAEQPHQWCQENQLVISEYAGHSAVQVCESKSSWGPDFVSIVEGIFCDMCERRSYPLCNADEGSFSQDLNASNCDLKAGSMNSTNPSTFYAKATATGIPKSQNKTSGSGITIGTCFDLRTKQLRAPAWRRRDQGVPVKRYNNIRHWK